MEEPLPIGENNPAPDTTVLETINDKIEDKFSVLNLDTKKDVDFSEAVAESERNFKSSKNGQLWAMEARTIKQMEADDDLDSNDKIEKEKRRGSLERYKPPTTGGTYSKEDREKHRRRGHFGEAKKPEEVQQETGDTKKIDGRTHGRFRGKGKGKDEKTSPNTGQQFSSEQNEKKESSGKFERGTYKSQLSKDWADYSFEDDNKAVEGKKDESSVSQQCTQTKNKHSNEENNAWEESAGGESLTWGDPSKPNNARNNNRKTDRPDNRQTNPRPKPHAQNFNQRNDYRHQQENVDLRQKLNDKRSSNPTFDQGSNDHNQRQQNGGSNSYGDNNRHQQRPSRGVVQSNWASKSEFERYSNDNNRGYRERDSNENNKSNNQVQSAAGKLPRPKKNTENFNPSHKPPEMRILFATPGAKQYDRKCGSRDVIVVRDLFTTPGVDPNTDLSLYNKLLDEIQNSGVNERLLWQSWHGDSHLIADDKRAWKKACPTFSWAVEKLAEYFSMDVQATRLNWYRDSSEWKPFHHDAAAMKPDKAKTQNMTVAVSFGAERDVAFEHAANRCIISMPQPNGTVYTFGRDVNILWRHGIPQLPPSLQNNNGRISIICWGWVDTFDM